MKALRHPILVANMDASKEPMMQGLYKKSTVVERSGRKIGIIGVIVSTVGVSKIKYYYPLVVCSYSVIFLEN